MSKPTTRTVPDEELDTDPYADIEKRAAAREEPPAEGADHPDPYAHLGSRAAGVDEPAAEESEEEEE